MKLFVIFNFLVSAGVSFAGPPSNLMIDLNAISGKGARPAIVIPVAPTVVDGKRTKTNTVRLSMADVTRILGPSATNDFARYSQMLRRVVAEATSSNKESK